MSMTSTTHTMPRDAALLQTLVRILQREWKPLFDVSEILERVAIVGVSAAPGMLWQPTTTSVGDPTVELRALVIGNKLFVHFVSADSESIRLDLVLDEYTNDATVGGSAVNERTQSRVGQWIVNDELLVWRLARNVFPHFGASKNDRNLAVTRAGAELGRLPEPLLLCIAPLLGGADFARLTQANKFLYTYTDKSDVWLQLLQQEYPLPSHHVSTEDAKQEYIRSHSSRRNLRSSMQSGISSIPDMDHPMPSRRLFIPLGLRQPGMIPPPFHGSWPHTNDPFHE